MGYLVPKNLVGTSREVRAHARTMVSRFRKGAHLLEAAGATVQVEDVECDIVVSLMSQPSSSHQLVWLPMLSAELFTRGGSDLALVATQLSESTWGLVALMGLGPGKFIATHATPVFLMRFRKALDDLASVGRRYRLVDQSRPEIFSRRMAPAVQALLQSLGVNPKEFSEDATVHDLLTQFAGYYEG